MLNSVLDPQHQSNSSNNVENYSPESLELGQIPRKLFHNTSWKNVLSNPRYKPGTILVIKENLAFSILDREMTKEIIRWKKSKKIMRLHNWKGMQVPVTTIVSKRAKPMLFDILHQNQFKTWQFKLTSYVGELWNIQELTNVLEIIIERRREIQELSLEVGLYNHNFDETKVDKIQRIIWKNLPNLKSLGWHQCFIESKDAKILSSQITKKLTGLKKLSFNFGGLKLIDSYTLTCIARNIGTNAPNLEKLKLFFWGIQRIPNEDFTNFAEQMCRNLTSLKYLHLNFRSCQYLSSTCLKPLSKEICENLFNLRVLILIFDACPEITKPDLDTLTNELSQSLPKLQYLSYSDTADAKNVLRELAQ